MLHLTASSRLDLLVDELAAVLGEPPDDPMTPEWIVVASAGMQRWLRLELARRLGTDGPGVGDGVAANLDMFFPATLRSRILSPDTDPTADPWDLTRLPWAVLDVLATAGSDPVLRGLAEPPPGGTRWARSRRLADLLDRYSLHRPEMLRRWAAGDDVDGSGQPLVATARWQPHLWRLVRDRIGSPSPAELLPERFEALRSAGVGAEVPGRISLFGLTTIPGGEPFLELLQALGAQRDVELFLFRPSPGMAGQVRSAVTAAGGPPLLRSDDRTDEAVSHPLLRPWARPSREAEVLLFGSEVRAVEADLDERGSLLSCIQSDIRSGTAPTGELIPRTDDRSIRLHSCYGVTRQVEVLRDEVLHLLAEDPTLLEDEIVVLCPDVEKFAPFIQAVFGPSAGGQGDPGVGTGARGTPSLRYRITDRSLSDTSPLFRALATLLDLVGSRFSAPALLDFIALPAVREKFGFDDAAVTRIAEWVENLEVRWGLDGAHRELWQVPASYEGGTWRLALDRLLTGICVSDDQGLPLAIGDVLPFGVEGDGIALVGRLADLVERLAKLVQEVRSPRSGKEWSVLLAAATDDLFAVGGRASWQEQHLDRVLTGIGESSVVGGSEVSVGLTLADVRRLLVDITPTTGGRPEFFRGGLTISSLTPLRGIPYRVVCLLGMDEGSFSGRGPDGDDLCAANPFVGDRDTRSDQRQAMLESVLAAQDVLVILHTGHSVVTSRPVPASVPLAELRDLVASTLDPSVRVATLEGVERVHPRQAFDERNFGAVTGSPFGDRPWSFDPIACTGASARLDPGSMPEVPNDELLPIPGSEVIDLGDLREFLSHPVSYFLRNVLQVTVPRPPERESGIPVRAGGEGGRGIQPLAPGGPDIPIELDGLALWKLKDSLLGLVRSGGDADSFDSRELAGGALPPGRLAGRTIEKVKAAVDPLAVRVRELGVVPGNSMHRVVDVPLPGGGRVVGTVRDDQGRQPGPVQVYPSQSKPKRRLLSWLDLIVLTAADPETDWWSVVMCTAKRKDPVDIEVMAVSGEDPAERRRTALEALEVVVDCYRRGTREPLPLFPLLSPALHKGSGVGSAWGSHVGGGDGDDRWIRLAFGSPTLDDLCTLPVRDHDPDGAGEDRARRYASYLWGAVDGSLAGGESGSESAGSSG